jgi:chloramphenicol O-acetyltransferase type A
MLPWIQFTNYTPIPYGNESGFFPVLQAGKFFDKDKKK